MKLEKKADGLWEATYTRENPGSSWKVKPLKRTHTIGCFKTEKEAVEAADAFIFQAMDALNFTNSERDALMTNIRRDKSWRSQEPTPGQKSLVHKMIGRDPAPRATKGDLTAFISACKYGQHYYGCNPWHAQ
jgi:hypothetical protein